MVAGAPPPPPPPLGMAPGTFAQPYIYNAYIYSVLARARYFILLQHLNAARVSARAASRRQQVVFASARLLCSFHCVFAVRARETLRPFTR